MKIVNTHEAKTNLSAILFEVENKGSVYLICRNGTPVADLIPHKKATKQNPLTPHPTMSKIKIKYDPTEPLSEDDWPSSLR